MESLAYLHLAVSVEADSNSTFADLSVPLQASCAYWNSLGRNWRSTRFWLRLLAITTNLTILAIAAQVYAQTLRYGDSGAEVAALQQCLVDRGYLDTDTFGNFMEKTDEAVRRFQRDYGLQVDGRVGSQTAAALGCNLASARTTPYLTSTYPTTPYPSNNWNNPKNASAATRRPLALNSEGTDVRELQQYLKKQGFDPGPIDGIFGSATANAVIRFQRAYNLYPDGKVGPDTWVALGLGGGRPSNPAADKYSVMALQQKLKDQGFYNGLIDGDLGSGTREAIAAAQQYYGVTHSEILTGRLPR